MPQQQEDLFKDDFNDEEEEKDKEKSEENQSVLSLDSMLVPKTPKPGQTQTGRKPVPFTEYHMTRKRKIENL